MKRIRRLAALILAISCICVFSAVPAFAADSAGMVTNISKVNIISLTTPTIKYKAHVQNKGWLPVKNGGQVAGTTGKSLRMEAFTLTSSKVKFSYRAHVAKIGWQNWKSNGQAAGTTGQGLAIEAVQIKLTPEYAKKYDVYYSVHVPNRGWLGWAKNGQTAGSTGLALRTEAIKIKLVKKGAKFNAGGKASLTKPAMTYNAHVQDVGWQSYVKDNCIAGTTGKAKRLEALHIKLRDFDGNNGISVRAHVAQIGWQSWKTSGQMAGTTGQGKAIEAVQINLSKSLSPFFDVYYRMHVADLGWLGWAKNGETAGTTGGGIRAEAIQIKIVNKNASFNRGGAAYINGADLGTLYWPVRRNGAAVMSIGTQHGQWLSINGKSWQHLGIDIDNAAGASWYAAYSGTIAEVYTGCTTNGYGDHSKCSPNHNETYNGACNSGFGNGIVIQCNINGQTYFMQYAHMNSVAFTSADKGKPIARGTYLGTVGDRGNSFGTHAHFEINQGRPFGPAVNNDPTQAGCIFRYSY